TFQLRMSLTLVTSRGKTEVARPAAPEGLRGAIVVVGLGSIGQRHFDNLAALGHSTLGAVRTGLGTRPLEAEDAGAHRDLQSALASGPLAVVVANPTAVHLETAVAAVRAGAHVFVEKPLSHCATGVSTLREEVKARALVAQCGFQFRFHPTLQRVKEWIDSGALGRVISAHVEWSECVRGWHPWEDYRRSYSTQRRLGGGVIRTLCHPFDYLRWLLGEVDWVSAQADRLSDLELDVEDTALVTLRMASGAMASVSLDYVGRPRRHRLEIVGLDGRIAWDAEDGVAYLHAGRLVTARPPVAFERNHLFRDEMSHFLDRIRRADSSLGSLDDGIRALEITLAAARAAETGTRVQL
ncbi:MAG TPA: Gfo/Idh/MocA family oxidoreductase, partial [Vicinamibacteria bacterium]|nr:Gfo/Idh/MocA family oxidoreductase [Vicinamibacteria bacterium]